MVIQDNLNYILFNNPISSNAIDMTKRTIGTIFRPKGQGQEVVPILPIIQEKVTLYKLAQESGPFVRIGGLIGASAVALGAYGAHRQFPKDKGADLQKIFETGNRYHFINSLAILCVPMSRCPYVSGTLLITGISLFSGACYYHAITGENKFGKMAPIGGMCLILGWAAMIL